MFSMNPNLFDSFINLSLLDVNGAILITDPIEFLVQNTIDSFQDLDIESI